MDEMLYVLASFSGRVSGVLDTWHSGDYNDREALQKIEEYVRKLEEELKSSSK